MMNIFQTWLKNPLLGETTTTFRVSWDGFTVILFLKYFFSGFLTSRFENYRFHPNI